MALVLRPFETAVGGVIEYGHGKGLMRNRWRTGDKEEETLSRTSPRAVAEEQHLPMQRTLTTSVVICAYTEDRWPLLLRSVSSVQNQSRRADGYDRLR